MLSNRARYLKILFDENKINTNNLDKAVTKGWITSEERQEILKD